MDFHHIFNQDGSLKYSYGSGIKINHQKTMKDTQLKIGDEVYNRDNKSIVWTITGFDGDWLRVRASPLDGRLSFASSVLHKDDARKVSDE